MFDFYPGLPHMCSELGKRQGAGFQGKCNNRH